MPRGHRLTPEQRERIRELRDQGLSCAQVAQALDVAPSTAWRLSPDIRPRAGSSMTDELRRRIRELRAAGFTATRVAAMVGVSKSTVHIAAPGYHDPRWLTPEQVAQIKELRADGHTQEHVARVVGCGVSSVKRYAPGRIGKVPVAPLREAFERSPLTAAEVAGELGWWAGDGKADCSRVKRTLGLLPTTSGSTGSRSRRTLTDAETVMRIADIIGVGWWTVVPDEVESEAAG
jgi:DNA invertase Pin-like site-specific DNA recombinase